jgi:hypothetical protein
MIFETTSRDAALIKDVIQHCASEITLLLIPDSLLPSSNNAPVEMQQRIKLADSTLSRFELSILN